MLRKQDGRSNQESDTAWELGTYWSCLISTFSSWSKNSLVRQIGQDSEIKENLALNLTCLPISTASKTEQRKHVSKIHSFPGSYEIAAKKEYSVFALLGDSKMI